MKINKILENNKKNLISIVTAIITSIITVALCLFWFQETKMNSNINTINENYTTIEQIKKDFRIANEALEEQIKIYIDGNYGYLSRRDEKVEKLTIYFRQQEQRLANIERALANL